MSSGVGQLSAELLTRIFQEALGEANAGVLLPAMLVNHRWKNTAEPVFWQRLKFTRPESVASVASALTAAFGRDVKIGSWVRRLIFGSKLVNQLKTDLDLLNNTIIVMSHVSNVVRFEMRPHIPHSILSVLHKTTCIRTLADMHLGFTPGGLDAITYIGEFKSLTSLNISFTQDIFRRPAHVKPWYLPQLKTFVGWTKFDPDSQLAEFIIECNFPAVLSLQLVVSTGSNRGADALRRLYQSKSGTLRVFFVSMADPTYYAALIPHMTAIGRINVENASPALIATLPASVSELRLRCSGVTADHLEQLDATLNELSSYPSHRVKTVHVNLTCGTKFHWVPEPESADVFQDTVFIQKLFRLSSRGLKILDDNGQSILDCISWR